MKSAVIVALISAVVASPLEARATVDMTLCQDVNYGGACRTWRGIATGQCINLDSDFNDKASSAKHSEHHSCRYWKDANCSGQSAGGTEDNIPDMTKVGFNDRISSWRCS